MSISDAEHFAASQKVRHCDHADSKLRIERGYGGTPWQVRCGCGAVWSCQPVGPFAAAASADRY